MGLQFTVAAMVVCSHYVLSTSSYLWEGVSLLVLLPKLILCIMTEPIDAYTLTKIEEAQGGRRDYLALVILSIVGLADVNATD